MHFINVDKDLLNKQTERTVGNDAELNKVLLLFLIVGLRIMFNVCTVYLGRHI